MKNTGPDRTDRTDRTDGTEQQPSAPERTDRTDRTEQELREALEALAGGVHPARPLPDAYRTARGEWLRRERRRRLVLAVLVAVVFALATLIGLWVLNQTPAHPGVIFSGTGTGTGTGSGTGDAVRGASLARPHP